MYARQLHDVLLRTALLVWVVRIRRSIPQAIHTYICQWTDKKNRFNGFYDELCWGSVRSYHVRYLLAVMAPGMNCPEIFVCWRFCTSNNFDSLLFLSLLFGRVVFVLFADRIIIYNRCFLIINIYCRERWFLLFWYQNIWFSGSLFSR